MTCTQDLITMIEGLGFAPSDIVSCLQEAAATTGTTPDGLCQSLWTDLMTHMKQCRESAARHGMELRPHQSAMVDHMIRNPGGIAVFSVGVGKSLTAAMTISCCLRLAELLGRPDVPVNIIAPVSLHDNMRKEMRAVGMNVRDSRIHFYSPASHFKQWKDGTLRDDRHAIMIIDEAHEYRKDYKAQFGGMVFGNDTDKQYQVESVIDSSTRAWKRLLLTATPMYSHVHDIVNLVTIARGRELTLAEYDLSWSSPEATRRTYGNLFMFQESDPQFYPKVDERQVLIFMTPEYYNRYMRAEKKKLGESEGKEYGKDAFITKLRQHSNKILPSLKVPEIEKILAYRQPTIFYSDFLEAGIGIIEAVAKRMNVPYRVVSGKTPKAKRQQMVDEYNRGEVQLLILSKAGALGLDTKNTRHVILMEKGWTRALEIQAIGRASRYKSHWNLPEEQRQVTVWHLMIVKPPYDILRQWQQQRMIKTITHKEAVDIILLDKNRGSYYGEIIPHMTKLRSVQISKQPRE